MNNQYNKKNKNKSIYIRSIAIIAACVAAILACLNGLTSPDSSDEWIYTVKCINIWLLPPLIIIAIIYSIIGYINIIKSAKGKLIWICCGILGAALIIAPFFLPLWDRHVWQYQYFLSICWALGLLLSGTFVLTASTKLKSVAASILSLAGSILLGLAAVEIYLLFTHQYLDGWLNLSAQSKYASRVNGIPEYLSWSPNECGATPAKPGNPLPAFHRLVKFDRDLYDIKYDFNAKGWRKLPQPNPDAPNDLLLFGCSFTYGTALENEQTWAWQLAELLGSDWNLENYAANGFSVNQMLCELEHRMIPAPEGKRRYALFLALDHHLRRNEFFPRTPHYELDASGKAIQAGRQKYRWIYELPWTINGLQIAREASLWLTNFFLRDTTEAEKIYLAMLAQANAILRDAYATRLYVLLWPGSEFLKDRIKALGIPVITAKPMLPDWDKGAKPGDVYRTDVFENHPNPKAATELASGLSTFFKNLSRQPEAPPQLNPSQPSTHTFVQ